MSSKTPSLSKANKNWAHEQTNAPPAWLHVQHIYISWQEMCMFFPNIACYSILFHKYK